MPTTVHRQCNLCEAHCGIAVEVQGTKVLRITGDPEDHFSRGYICPKAAALTDLYEDPDRVTTPLRKTADGGWEPLGWDEALDAAAAGLRRVREQHGADAIANYLGNPGAHSWSVLAFLTLRLVLGTRNNYSATSTDQLPQHLTSAEMLGTPLVFPIPDLERTDHLLVLGANPAVSNGSVMSAPGVRDRLRAVKARGGTVIVVDPRRTETARLADEHVAVRPGGDPYLLLGVIGVLFAEGLVAVGRLAEHVDGVEELRALTAAWTPQRAAEHSGVDADTIVRLARGFAAAPSAVAYGRVGVCQTQTGTVTHWLITALNTLTGNLDRPGGAMFTTPPVDPTPLLQLVGKTGFRLHRTRTARVSGLPNMNGEFPIAGLADEITTPGDGQVRGLVVYAGNPVLSAPGGAALDAALPQLDFMVAIDQYVTETTRHADIILPPVSALERDDLDFVMPAVSVRNHVRFSPAAVPKRPGGREDWQIINGLSRRLGTGLRRRGVAGAVHAATLLKLDSPARILDLALAMGPYGVLRRGPLKGLTVARVRAAEHGIDLGPLEPRLPGMLTTPGRRVQLAPELFVEEARRLDAQAREQGEATADGFDLTLIGRRSLRSNNSWLHNSRRLMKGADRCVALLHPDDAQARGLSDGALVRVSSRVGAIDLPVQVSDELRPGVVSIPHGFGHGREGVGWTHAAAKPGVSVNDITDPTVLDRLTGNAAYNSVAVRVEAVPVDAAAAADDAALAAGGR
ncbi:molybdopterin-dependent oxidoreductase [Paraconexibacter algicola]|uniref:Oxidoreductase n=1 Tax=Paraconexibacter algicola TaxID=2133960 RepID=A0A2T4UDG2_9ACTN|nr:molybdopterin-dependent oxidoreductase [Paraconexibacter algicola]PTL55543.1 oxidoreductase [Paraconexibacter algicola]